MNTSKCLFFMLKVKYYSKKQSQNYPYIYILFPLYALNSESILVLIKIEYTRSTD